MSITAVHGDGARRLKFEYRPTTWISHGIQTLCGIQYHKLLPNGQVRAGLYYRGWRYKVEQACFRLQALGNRWI
jgi:hypothetical protein